MTTGLIISAPTIAKAQFSLVGIAPLMTARFSKKAEIMQAQEGGTYRTCSDEDVKRWGLSCY